MRKFVYIIVFFILPWALQSQSYYVDKNGVLRSSIDKQEVSFFGVNYTLPFAHAYRMHKLLGVDLKKAIDQDVYHFARLGFSAYRIHVWDVEISDKEGNLIENEHLDLLDYLISKLKERNIKILYTPIAFWGNGYPEKGEKLPGFSSNWNKCEMTSVEEAICAQEKYLYQFVNHLNPYTGLAIKNDPDVVGFEINNEPCNATSPDKTTLFVNRMVNTIRETNCKKPVFYNVSHNFQNTQAFYNTNIDGGTFQWYPSGLVAGHTRQGNFLPAVDSYPISFDSIRNYKNKAKIVYEFDPADIADPYIYPAMVRSFRSAGFQWITQFAYDPMAIAWANTEYQTHFLNLAYTPGKAISMKIATEVAKDVRRYANYGTYPADTIFDSFRVSYKEKLSIMNSDSKFFYSNNTADQPININKLREVAGCGSSRVVSYEGTGAYFLDKLSDGVWRLEVMPDAIWVQDPFSKTSIKKEVALTIENEWAMQINLPDLGNNFMYQGINHGNMRNGISDGSALNIRPGVFLLTRKGLNPNAWTTDSRYKNIQIGEYAAPLRKISTYHVIHKPAVVITAGEDYLIKATIVGPAKPDSVQLNIYSSEGGFRGRCSKGMERAEGYNYQVKLPAEQITSGLLQYSITVYEKNKTVTFPAAVEGSPLHWDFYDFSAWSVRIESPQQYITLYDSNREYNDIEVFLVNGKRYDKRLRAGEYPGQNYTLLTTSHLSPKSELLIRHYIKNNINGRRDRLSTCKELCIKTGQIRGIDSLRIGFITADGLTYKKQVPVTNENIRIQFSDLELGKTMLQPRSYPSFLPDYFEPQDKTISFKQSEIEFIEISTGQNNQIENPVVGIESIWIE